MAKTDGVNEACLSPTPGQGIQGGGPSFAPGARCLSALLALLLGVSSLSFSGCCGVFGRGGDAIGRFMEQQANCLRDRVWARRAFLMRYPHCDHPNPRDFQSGFSAGYADILQGGVGETPTLPPERYWSTRYSNEEGASRQTAWFAGFATGAAAAQQDGTGAYYEIQISQELREAMQQQNASDARTRKVDSVNPDDVIPLIEPIPDPDQEIDAPMPQVIPGTSTPGGGQSDVDQPMPLSFDIPVIRSPTTKPDK